MANEELPFHYVPPVDPNIGRRVDRYFILRKLLGRGGMGAAYLAEHEARAHVKCVVKIVLAEIAQHPLAISRYNTEIHAVSLFNHDNIVRLQNFGVLDDGQLFSRFEYIVGTSLDRYVAERGGRLDLRKAAYFIFQLCDALHYAHAQQVIHRDLKPDNVMIEDKPPGSHLAERVKLLDFGIAKVAGAAERTRSGISMGTPRYSAPEQVTNAASATGRADVFSLGVIFYQLVVGDLPWGTPESDIAIYHKQQTQAPRWPPEDLMPAEVAAVVIRTLSLKPEDRPSMHEFAIELACAIAAEGSKPSGTEILKDVKRDWVTSAPPHTPTLPRPVAADPTAQLPPQLASDAAPESGALSPGVAASSVHIAAPASARSELDLLATANARPGGRAGAVASHGAAASSDTTAAASAAAIPATQSAAPSASTAELGGAWRPPTRVLAALPTGLVSQNYAAQPSVEQRAPSAVVASEIDLAVGTPGPQPFAHAELPAVMVSRTQLPGFTPQLSTPAAGATPQVVHGELSSPVALPDAARRRWRTTVAFSIVTFALVAVVSFALTRRGSPSSPGGVPASDPVSGSTLTAAPTASKTAAEERPAAMSAPSPSRTASGVVALAVDAGTAPTATNAAGKDIDHAVPNVAPRVAAPSLPASPTGETTHVSAKRATTSAPIVAQASPAPVTARADGELVISVRPWAAVWLNGKSIPDGTPYRSRLPAGRYRVRLANDDVGQSETLTVTVEPNKTKTIERQW